MTLVQSESVLAVDGVDLWIRRRGSGPPVVCLHSVGHDGRDFDSLVDRCADTFEFICIDWPGHGRSGPDPAPASAASGAMSGDVRWKGAARSAARTPSISRPP